MICDERLLLRSRFKTSIQNFDLNEVCEGRVDVFGSGFGFAHV